MKNTFFVQIIIWYALFLLYAVVRYILLKEVSWQHFPLYINNKAISWLAVTCIAASFIYAALYRKTKQENYKTAPKFFGLAGFALALFHSIISIVLLSPSYYQKFYQASGKLNFTGEFSMLFGSIAIVLLSVAAWSSSSIVKNNITQEEWQRLQRCALWGFLATAVHLVFMSHSWVLPNKWPNLLPPISLLSFLTIAVALSIRFLYSLRK